MRGAMPPLPQYAFMALCLVKHRDNFTFFNMFIFDNIVFNTFPYTVSPTLREEHRLKVFKNRVLRRIFGLKRDEVVGGWR
jgi:hypothetical protein